MNKTLLLIAACSLGLSMPVQAKISHKTLTFAGYAVAGLSAIGAGAAGIFWYRNSKKLDDTTLNQEEREAILSKIAKLQTACVGASILTVASGAYAIREHITWNKENKELKKKKAENGKFKAEVDKAIKKRTEAYEITLDEEYAHMRKTFTEHFSNITNDTTKLKLAKSINDRFKAFSKIFERALSGETLEDYEALVLVDRENYGFGYFTFVEMINKVIRETIEEK